MSEKKIAILSSDGDFFEVDQDVADQFQIVNHLKEDNSIDGVIPLPNIDGKILSKVIEYCKKHNGTSSKAGDGDADVNELKNWDAEFMKVDQTSLFDLLMAANCLGVKSLLEITCDKVAEMINSETTEKVQETSHKENEFTPEEEAPILPETTRTID